MVREACEPLHGSARDYDGLLDLIGGAKVVLLGEATHGTHEFYRERAQITKRLIVEKGFNAVAAEADWPDAHRINRFVRGRSDDLDAVDALTSFKRFPQWMWRNADVLDFVGWLREHNDHQPKPSDKCGFYGLDLYSLHSSIDAVIAYLDKVDPKSGKRARERYGCFDHAGQEIHNYGLAASLGLIPSCEQEVVNELVELQQRQTAYLARDGEPAADDFLSAQQNALVVRNAEEYYRTMYRTDFSSWNLRDTHMMESLVSLFEWLSAQRGISKIVVWAHNSHVGDASATQKSERGEINLGQLARKRFGRAAMLIGFTTFEGTVTAASGWDEPVERKTLLPALQESYEYIFHECTIPRFWLPLNREPGVTFNLRNPRLERAVGVVYRPQTELLSHYLRARLPDQFDAVIHVDHTRAVEPLERTPEWRIDEVEETFPSGL